MSASVPAAVKAAIADFDNRGFAAIVEYTQKFDKFDLLAENIQVDETQVRSQAEKLTSKQRTAIDIACTKTLSFQQKIAQAIVPVVDQTEDGTTKFIPVPMKRIGIYVPGGLAALPSSLMMVAVSAQAAGVKEMVVCTPPRSEGLNPAIAYLILKFGITEVYRVGGIAAIWLMANGMRGKSEGGIYVEPVNKICGPGNAYVAEAKAQLAQSGKVGIDMLAGPSEVLVLADETANPAFVAADLLAQAEHGITSSALLITDSDTLAVSVQKEVDCQLAKMNRGEDIAKALRSCGGIFVVGDLLKDGVSLADDFASEHLEIFCEESITDTILEGSICAGAIFVRTGEAFADYGMTGGNHVLPTSRTARFSSGLSARDFFVWQYVEELTGGAQQKLADAAATFALELESLEAHANAATVRNTADTTKTDTTKTRGID